MFFTSKNKVLLVICIFFTYFAFFSHSASFNCTNVTGSLETVICEDKLLSTLDEKMSHYFNLLKVSLNKDEQNKLVQEQRQWLKSREVQCPIENKNSLEIKQGSEAELSKYVAEFRKNNMLFYVLEQKKFVFLPAMAIYKAGKGWEQEGQKEQEKRENGAGISEVSSSILMRKSSWEKVDPVFKKRILRFLMLKFERNPEIAPSLPIIAENAALLVFRTYSSHKFLAGDCLKEIYPIRNFELWSRMIPQKSGEFSLNITSGIRFADFTVLGKLTSSMLRELDTVSIDGFGQFPKGLKADDGYMVKNCRDYRQHSVPSNNTYDMSMASFFDLTCGIINRLKTVNQEQQPINRINKIPETAKISDPRYLSLTVLPFGPARIPDRIASDSAKGLSVYDYLKEGKVSFVRKDEKNEKNDYSIKITYPETSGIAYLDEITRADFNGDGNEEVLLSYSQYVIGGSYKSFQICLVRFDPEKRMFMLNDNSCHNL